MVEVSNPRDFLVTDGRETDLHYRTGRIQLIGLESYSSCIVVAEAGGQLLICVPRAVWDRRTKDRFLPTPSFQKAILVSVASVTPEDRETVLDNPLQVWIGLLAVKSERFLDFSNPEDVQKTFHEEDQEEALPFGESLVAVAAEHFTFLSAEEELEPGGGEDADYGQRIEKVEGALAGIQAALETLLSREDARKPALRRPSASSGAVGASPKKEARSRVSFDGLDKTVVEAALSAGIQEDHLSQMAALVRKQPGRMEDIPRDRSGGRRGELSDSENSSEEEEEEDPTASGSGDGVAKAIVKLTKVCSVLASNRRKKQDGIEHLLDQTSLGAGGEGSGLGSGRKNSQALRALRRCLSENPEYIYKSIEANLLSDFTARAAKPGEPLGNASARGWLESRSRIQNYTTHVRWSWAVAGIWDDLMRGEHGSARARAALLIAASDQAAIDGGSWLLSNISMLEPVPPFQSFSSHQSPSSQELQHSALWDPRWFELFLAHVKEMDSYQETRKKLAKQPTLKPPKSDDPPKAPKVPKPKPKGKSQGKEKEEEQGSQ